MQNSNIKYSVLFAGHQISADAVLRGLQKGYRLIIFTDSEEHQAKLQSVYHQLCQERHLDPARITRYLEVFLYRGAETAAIPDGCLTASGRSEEETLHSLRRIAEEVPEFNLGQYLVEHAPLDRDICVAAGAGTGKTAVMVQRIMYILHMTKDPDLSRIAMITFTNKSTDEMRDRLIRELNTRYQLTGRITYLNWMEQISRLPVSTIHSFFRSLLTELGAMKGYGTGVTLRSFRRERQQILMDILNESFTEAGRTRENVPHINSLFGLSVHDIQELAEEYWTQIDNHGLTPGEISALSWGEADTTRSRHIQEQLSRIFAEAEKRYEALRVRENSLSMNDIIRELGELIRKPNAREYLKSHYDYLFCDEFQDSDNVQIQALSLLAQVYSEPENRQQNQEKCCPGCRLFVVGDIKQSIYRFRGATDSAFVKLGSEFEAGRGSFTAEENQYRLTRNYRTHTNILEALDPLFMSWGQRGFLPYQPQDRLEPGQTKYPDPTAGKFRLLYMTTRNRMYRFLEVVQEIRERDPGAVITVLTRNNRELSQIAQWCRNNRDSEGFPDPISCIIDEKGGFYQSPAVLDFCIMAEALLYEQDPICLFHLLNSPYAPDAQTDDPSWIRQLIAAGGDASRLLPLMNARLEGTPWVRCAEDSSDHPDPARISYRKAVREQPILSVLRRIIQETDPTRGYIRQVVHILTQNAQGSPSGNTHHASAQQTEPRDSTPSLTAEKKKRICGQAAMKGRQYQSDLGNLLQILTEHFSTSFGSLADITEYLRIMIAANHEESCSLAVRPSGGYVEGYTVHSSKGLQFEYVLLPFMNDPFVREGRNEILFSGDHRRAGWSCTEQQNSGETAAFCNNNYVQLKPEENREVLEEETRLLYVAMTRTEKELCCFLCTDAETDELPDPDGENTSPNSWYALFTEGDRHE